MCVACCLGLGALGSTLAGAAEPVKLVDVNVPPSTPSQWAAELRFSDPGFDVTGVQLDASRYYVDIEPATWPGSSVRGESEDGVIAYRWAQFSVSPPIVRIVVEARPGWSCSSATRAATVDLSCQEAPGATAETSVGSTRLPQRDLAADSSQVCEAVARVHGLAMCTPLKGFSNADILARSLGYFPKDVVRDGLPHFGAVRDDWRGAPRSHQGLDVYGDTCDVLAMADGTVIGMGRGEKAGGWVKLAHGSGVETVYVHLRRIRVERGAKVRQGQRIGRIEGPVGNAVEAQLHIEFKLDGASVDPAPFFQGAARGSLMLAWKQAISAIPQRVRRRERELKAHGATPPTMPATTASSQAQSRAP
jgi:hypothetical protein